jgi:hypothetical protein
MHPVVFSRSWFARHQRTLLMLLAMPVIGRELRDVLAIRRCDVGYDRRIVALAPHYYIVANPDGTLTMDCRTHTKYAKRLRYQLDGLWRAAHGWDRFVANPLLPALNVGFDTFTVFPDPDPEVTTVDGFVSRENANEDWSTLRNGAGNNPSDADVIYAWAVTATATTNQWKNIYRGIYLFDTTTLSGSVVTDAVLSLFGADKTDGLGVTPDVDIYAATPASDTALAAADYGQIGTTPQTSAPTSYANQSGSAYTDLTLLTSAITAGGITKLATRNANYDVANVAPTWSSAAQSLWQVRSSEASGSSQDPKLVVTFSAAAEALITLLGTAPV